MYRMLDISKDKISLIIYKRFGLVCLKLYCGVEGDNLLFKPAYQELVFA